MFIKILKKVGYKPQNEYKLASLAQFEFTSYLAKNPKMM